MTGIGQSEHDVAAGLAFRVGAAGRLVQFHRVGFNGQQPALRHSVTSVDGQIHEDLAELAEIDLDEADLGIERGAENDVFTEQALQHALHVLDHNIEVEHLGLQHGATAVGEELAGESSGACAGLQDGLDAGAQLVAGGQIGENHFAVTRNDGEQIVEIVRHPACQLADGFQLLGLVELRLQFLFFRDVLHDTDEMAAALQQEPGNGEIDGEGGTIFAQSPDLPGAADHLRLAGPQVVGEVAIVLRMVRLRHQHFHVGADDLGGGWWKISSAARLKSVTMAFSSMPTMP